MNLMIKENGILKYQYISLENKVSWIYVLSSKKARWNWHDLYKRSGISFIKNLSNDLPYSQREGGFLNTNLDEFSFLS